MKNIKNRGFTLIELLVSIGISIFLIGAITKVMLQSKENIRTQDNVEKIQNDAKFALDLLTQDTRMAGFRGCISNNFSNFKNATTSNNYQSQITAIQGYEGKITGFSPSLDTAINNLNPIPNKEFDVITIRVPSTNPIILINDLASFTDKMKLSDTTNLTVGKYAIISNCTASTLFKINSIVGNAVSSDNSAGIGYLFPVGSQLYTYDTITYYVGAIEGKNYLYRQINSNSPEQISDNIDKFKIIYGVDTDNDLNANKYIYGSLISPTDNIVSIRVGLVIKSNDNGTIGSSKSQYSYNFNGVKITPNDSKVRKIYYTTINLRNMVL